MRKVQAPITTYLHAKAAALGIPLNGTFELTPVCNMNCRMCYVRLSKEQQEAIHPLYSYQDWLELAKKAKEMGLLYLLLTGGEIFLYPHIRELIEGLHQMGIILSLNTNGTLIDEEVVEWLKKSPPVRVNITLYGASDETYARLCRNPQGYTQATRGIRLLKQAGINVKINCSVTPYNKQDLEKIFAFCDEENLICEATSYMFPPVRKDQSMVGQNDRFTPEEAAEQSQRIEMLSLGKERYLERYRNNEMRGLGVDLEEDCDIIEGEGMRCRAGKCSFWITWNGRMSACGMFPITDQKNVFVYGLEQCWEETKAFAKSVRLPAKCSVCSHKDYCQVCAAVALSETGSFTEVPAYRCAMAKEYPLAVQRTVQMIEEENNEKA